MKQLGQERWKELVEMLEASGLSQVTFARQEGVNVGTLRSWIYRLRSEVPSRQAFLPVVVAQTVQPTTGMCLELPNGIQLRFEIGTAPSYVAELAGALGRSC